MQNKHLEHPEDSILSGDLTVLDWFMTDSDVSVKIDGKPAIVWGTDPATGTKFVGTKSVFNKRKIKIAHSHQEIDDLYDGEVATILHDCFTFLPQYEGIVQGDFLGWGMGEDTFTPNTVTYVFPDLVEEIIVVAPHTLYATDGELKDAYTINDMVGMEAFISNEFVRFVQPDCWQVDDKYRFSQIIGFARQMAQLVDFVEPFEAEALKIALNKCIREGREVNPDDFNNSRLISYWFLIKSIKEDMLKLCRNNGPRAYLGNRQCIGEGYVRTNEFGMFKLVNRESFSFANFATNNS
tara:strand:+ start:329 stop:1213 length:885 start_codon:yes stop_codon:yes gene_type:complete